MESHQGIPRDHNSWVFSAVMLDLLAPDICKDIEGHRSTRNMAPTAAARRYMESWTEEGKATCWSETRENRNIKFGLPGTSLLVSVV